MQSLIEIRSFLLAADLSSFSAAARQLGLTPSAVSKHVRKLEDELNIRLFERSTRKIVLTERGEQFFALSAQPTRDLMEASQMLTEAHTAPQGLLRISCATDFGRKVIVPLLGSFMQIYPKIRCELILTDSISKLVTESFDISIRLGSKLSDSTLVSKKIMDFALTTCASPAYLERNGTPKSIDKLNSHQCITITLPKTGKILDWSFVKNRKIISFRADRFMTTNDPDALRLMALQDMGIIQTGSYAVEKDIQQGRLKELFKANSAKHWAAYMIYPSKRYLNPKVRVFVDFVSSQF